MYHQKPVPLPSFPRQNETRARMKKVAMHRSSPRRASKAPRAPRTHQCSYGPWVHGGVRPAPERGNTGNGLAALPRQHSPSRAGPCGHCSSAALKAWSATAGHPISAAGTADRPPAGAHFAGSQANPVPNMQPWDPPHLAVPREQPSQHSAPARGRHPSPGPLIGSDERHAARHTHVSHNLNHLRTF